MPSPTPCRETPKLETSNSSLKVESHIHGNVNVWFGGGDTRVPTRYDGLYPTALRWLVSPVRWSVWWAVGIASLWGLPGCGSVPSDQTPHGAAAAQVAQAKGRADASATPEAQTEAIPITIAEVVRRPIAAYLQGTATLES